METVGTWFHVGEKFPLYQRSVEMMKGLDGGFFESLEEGEGFLLSIFLNRPHPKEIESIRNKTVQIRLLEEDDFILPLIKFGNDHFIFEMSLDPTLYEDTRALQFNQSNNLILIVLIDSNTQKIVAMRQANLPLKMIQKCTEVWSKAFLDMDYSKKYSNWLNQIQTQPLERLWMKGIHVGKLGESYNLEEIHYRTDSQFYTLKQR